MNDMIVWSGNGIMKVLINNEEIKMMVSEKFLRLNNILGGKSLADFMLQNTMDKLALYRKIFGVEILEKICFETYDVDTELDEFFERRREVDKSPIPSYCRGFFDDKSKLSCSCNHANAAYKSGWWYSAVGTNAHEAFHLYYKKYVYGNDRIVWFDEGMAQFISGEKDWLLNDEVKLEQTFRKFLDDYVPIDNLNVRWHGGSEVSDEYIFDRPKVFRGYTASLLIIKYIDEVYGRDYLYELMKDNKKIREFGNRALEEMVSYYKKKYTISDGIKL